MFRLPAFLLALTALAAPAAAQQGAFDLSGPSLRIDVTREGATLPMANIPALRAGDRVKVAVDVPDDGAVRYLLIVAFLRGATNPPPKDWITGVQTWKRKKNVLNVTVPQGAEQAIAFLAPQTGGGFDTVVDAVRARPGVFVRAAQDLHQASLDRARLEAYVAGIAAVDRRFPERLATVSPVLANALAIRLNPDCLSRPRDLQAACLTQNREGMVLQTTRSTTLAETLIGTPTDLAYRIAATREGGAGFYSPYIGLARDLARLFGAFRTAQYQYVPALAVAEGEATGLRLNTPPSFQNPRSVLVAPLPPIATGLAPAPDWRIAGNASLCITRPGAVLPLENAQLLFATRYARDLALRIETRDGAVASIPLRADPARGGLVLDGPPADLAGGAVATATVVGKWGLDPFDGPSTTVGTGPATWAPQPDASVIVGRDHPLVLRGGAPACIDRLVLRDAKGGLHPLKWQAAGDGAITVTLPLAEMRPGTLTLLVSQAGRTDPDAIELTARVEASRLDGFVLHEGDAAGTLRGSRLDQVGEVRLDGVRFVPGALTRGKDGDRLAMTAEGALPTLAAGITRDAMVRLRDGRGATAKATVAAPRPRATLLNHAVELPAQAGMALVLPEGVVPPDGRLTFSLRLADAGFDRDDAVEVAAPDASAALTVAGGTVQRVGSDVAIATVEPRALFGPGTIGEMRVRVVRDGVAGDWQPLGRVVRLPAIAGLACPAGTTECTLSGGDLYTLAAVSDAADFAGAVTVPPGFVGRRITLPRPAGDTLYLRLQDAPDLVVRATVAAGR